MSDEIYRLEQERDRLRAEGERLRAVVTRWFEWQAGINDMPPKELLDESKTIIGPEEVDRIIYDEAAAEGRP